MSHIKIHLARAAYKCYSPLVARTIEVFTVTQAKVSEFAVKNLVVCLLYEQFVFCCFYSYSCTSSLCNAITSDGASTLLYEIPAHNDNSDNC